MLSIKNINVSLKNEDKKIIKDLSLEINDGETHAIMGPNGTGKSTLAKVIMGHYLFALTSGEIFFNGTKLNDLTTDERARLGIFLGMQMPLEIEGVSNADFMRSAVHAKEGDSFQLFPFIKKMNETVKKLKMSLKGEVVRVEVDKDINRVCGIKFLDLTDIQIDKIIEELFEIMRKQKELL